MASLSGVDVSHWQGPIDWVVARAGGVDFVYIKATDGEFGLDPRFGVNWGAARVAAIPRGAYHFFRQVDVEGQITRFISAVGEDAGELPPALDLEVGPMDRGEFDLALVWLEAIAAHYGRSPVVYLDHTVLTKLAMSGLGPKFARYSLWLADYSGMPTFLVPPSPWFRWTFLQHTPQGSAPGIHTAVDLDTFAGGADELASLIRARTANAG
jgi:lysozyme